MRGGPSPQGSLFCETQQIRKIILIFQYFNIYFNYTFADTYSILESFEYDYILSFNSIDHWEWEQVEIGVEPQNMKVGLRILRTEKI